MKRMQTIQDAQIEKMIFTKTVHFVKNTVKKNQHKSTWKNVYILPTLGDQ